MEIAQALVSLQTTDAVIGRCEDGGFYLLGLRRCPPGLLAGLPCSTAGTASATIASLEQHGFRTAGIEPLFDVDTPDDLHRLAGALRNDASCAPATRAWLLRNGACLVS